MKTRVWMLAILLLTATFGGYLRSHYGNLEEPILPGTDPSRFYNQALKISEQGKLPERDMTRWMPVGRDLSTSLNLWSYVMAYSYRLLHLFSSRVSLHKVAVLSPVVCYALSALVLFLVIRTVTGNAIAGLLTAFVYAVFPGGTARASSGFCDRDAWCLLVIATGFWLYALSWKHYDQRHKPYVFIFLSGIAMAVLALSWEASGLFSGLFFFLFIVELMNRDQERKWRSDLCRYSLFVVPLVFTGLFLTNAYRGKANYSTPIEVVFWSPLLVFVVFGLLSYSVELGLQKARPFLTPILAFPRQGGRKLPFPGGNHWGRDRESVPFLSQDGIISNSVLLIIGVVFAVGLCSAMWLPGDRFLWHKLLASFSSSLGQNRLMQSVGELKDYPYERFREGWGWALLLFVPGAILMFWQAFRNYLREYWILIPCIFLFAIEITSSWIGVRLSGVLAGILLIGILGWIIWASSHNARPDYAMLLIVLYGFVMLIVTRGSIRYDFFLAPFLAWSAAMSITALFHWLKIEEKYIIPMIGLPLVLQPVLLINNRKLFLAAAGVIAGASITILFFKKHRRHVAIPLIILTMLVAMIQIPVLGASGGTRNVMEQIREFIAPSANEVPTVLKEIGEVLPQDSVILARWDMGSRINLVSQKATVVDEDHFRPYWIHLAYRHVFCAESEEEALQFLKTRNATHLLFCPQDLATFEGFGYVGGDRFFDRASGPIFYRHYEKRIEDFNEPYFELELQFPRSKVQLKASYSKSKIVLKSLSFRVFDPSLNKAIFKRFSRIYVDREEADLPDPDRQKLEKSPYILIIFTESKRGSEDIAMHFFVVHEKAYNQLFVRLYVLNEQPKYFTRVYERQVREGFKDSAFQMWRVNYPKDLVVPEALEKKYISHEFPDEALHKDWYFGARKRGDGQ